MYEQLDGILTCRDLVRGGRAGLRSPWVPLQGAQDGPRYLYLGSMYLNLGPPERSYAPRDVQETSRAYSGAVLVPSGRPWRC